MVELTDPATTVLTAMPTLDSPADRRSAPMGADLIAAAASMGLDDLGTRLDELFLDIAAAQAKVVVMLGEIDRREGYRSEGATSTEAWATERFGISTATARALTRVGRAGWDMPELIGSLCRGELSFDKVRALAQVATPETDAALCEQAKDCTVRELVDVAATTKAASIVAAPPGAEHDQRYVRFNDQCRTMSVQLPAESYAETRACLEARAADVPSNGDTPWDQRLCDAFMGLIRSSSAGSPSTTSPYVVVVHARLSTLVDDAGETGELAAELERDGLITANVLRQIACDATVALAVDDDVGHTMYEGRRRRFPNDAQRREVMRRDRHCRFPGCTNVTFTNIHHITAWKQGGTTDVENLALLCLHHHHVVHSKGWAMTGNANHELTFVGPSGRAMLSRPSPLWSRISEVASSAQSRGDDIASCTNASEVSAAPGP